MNQFCDNCGSPLDTDSRFCTNCGKTIEDTPPVAPAPAPVPTPVPAPVPKPVPAQPTYVNVTAPTPQKHSNLPLIIIIVILLLIILVGGGILLAVLVLDIFDGGNHKAEVPVTSETETAITLQTHAVTTAAPTTAPTTVATTTQSTTTTAPTTTTTKANSSTGREFIADSDTRYLTNADVAGMDDWTLMMAINEIYARHGRIFNDADVRTYFENLDWYEGTIAPENFSDDMLSAVELANVQLLLEKRGRLTTTPPTSAPTSSYTEANFYLFPHSSTSYMTQSEVDILNDWELMMGINEIYARNGRLFNDADVRTYFENQSWYNGYISPSDFTDDMLSDVEYYNINLMLAERQSR